MAGPWRTKAGGGVGWNDRLEAAVAGPGGVGMGDMPSAAAERFKCRC